MLSDAEHEKSLDAYRTFLAERKTVVISTKDENGEPFLSIVPFAIPEDSLYVYVSEIADHYTYLHNAETACVLIYGGESESVNLFDIERARFACTVIECAEEGHDAAFEKLGARTNAKMVDLLRTLDFHLFRLTPQQGRYVVGFGKAFDVIFDGSRFDHGVIDKNPVATESN
ncbi:pyridoxamine 5'-phosphate oxidase family protein [Rhodococcus sp. IEGM 1379]|uniref:pyridoxamine 5'-phosphate oxidase family protein n=1 Tax=Rhodococcus sp. IEGM 1379 TaxID=3047086 RepID=UPI0024B65A6D|nr:pyridoxamine 5'-phosphate oxidase family protein [Rhodococcus sp. IEGM 1379]MDI9918866.1 pyridoxamine 5'-phosphate oxidase family protein [Rhodococcus sp. IEGM 1379]